MDVENAVTVTFAFEMSISCKYTSMSVGGVDAGVLNCAASSTVACGTKQAQA